MQAELHGKIDLSPGWEDTLTDAVFSALRYLPADALGRVLSAGFPGLDFSGADLADVSFEFWPTFSNGYEPDVVIRAGKWMVIVEAKLGAGFGKGESIEEHQLYREWEGGLTRASAEKRTGPILLAVTADTREPDDVVEVREALGGRCITTGTAPDQVVRWLSWHQVGGVLDSLRDLNRNERLLVDDVLAVMERRRVRHVFKGFDVNDYQKVTEAVAVSETSVFPAFATLERQLTARLGDEGIQWGHPEFVVWSYGSKSMSKPWDWVTTYLLLPYWPDDFPARTGSQAVLFVMCNFVEPKIEVGWFQATYGYSSSKAAWTPLADRLAEDLGTVPPEYEVVLGADDYARAIARRPATEVDEPWLVDGFSRSRILRIQRSLDLSEVHDAAQVAEMVIETRELIAGLPSIRQSLLAAKLIVDDESSDPAVEVG